jgi:hypothetical protein
MLERVAATLSALLVVGLVAFLLVRNSPIGDPMLSFSLRLILSLSTAILGATIPGFLGVRWQGKGLAIRAGGALALFLLAFVYSPTPTPTALPAPKIEQSSTGPLSPPIADNKGNVTINGTINNK